jgi:hypothetical protein
MKGRQSYPGHVIVLLILRRELKETNRRLSRRRDSAFSS